MKEESEIDTKWVTDVKDKLFSKDPLTKGEIIIIITTIILTIIIIYASYKTTCQIDCSQCTNINQLLIQRGFK